MLRLMHWKRCFTALAGSVWALGLLSCTVPLEPEVAEAEPELPQSPEVGTVPVTAPPGEPIEPVAQVPFSAAVEVESGDPMTLWLINADTGERVQSLLKKSAQRFTPEFSPDKEWLVVSEVAFSDLQTLHLFKQSAPNRYTRIQREDFIGRLWDEFTAELQHSGVITRYVTSFKGWKEDSVALQLAVLPKNGSWIQKDYEVDLAKF